MSSALSLSESDTVGWWCVGRKDRAVQACAMVAAATPRRARAASCAAGAAAAQRARRASDEGAVARASGARRLCRGDGWLDGGGDRWCGRLVLSGVEAEGRAFGRHEGGIGDNAQYPAVEAEYEVEDRSRVGAAEQEYEGG